MRVALGWLIAAALGQAAPVAAPTSHAAPSPQASPDPIDDVVVIAGKMRRIRVRYAATGRVMYACHAERSSGDKAIDRLACRVVEQCVHRGFTEPDRALACFRHVQQRLDDEAAAAIVDRDGRVAH